jgi:hypothetical protein
MIINSPTISGSLIFADGSSITGSMIADNITIGSGLTDYVSIASSTLGSNTLITQATGSYTSAFFKYTVVNGTNARAGEVIVVWNGATAEYTDFSTLDIGNTTAVTASAAISTGNVQLNIQTNTSGWNIKSLATFI